MTSKALLIWLNIARTEGVQTQVRARVQRRGALELCTDSPDL